MPISYWRFLEMPGERVIHRMDIWMGEPAPFIHTVTMVAPGPWEAVDEVRIVAENGVALVGSLTREVIELLADTVPERFTLTNKGHSYAVTIPVGQNVPGRWSVELWRTGGGRPAAESRQILLLVDYRPAPAPHVHQYPMGY